MAMSNVSFMYSLLYMIAVHQHLCSTLPISTVLYYRAQAIAAIDSAISDPNPKVRISDATIGAVFQSLWGEEAMVCFLDGREEEYFHRRAMHLGGLLKMVHLRGGLESLASNRFLQASLLWYTPRVLCKVASNSADAYGTSVTRQCTPWPDFRSQICPFTTPTPHTVLLSLKGSDLLVQITCSTTAKHSASKRR